MSNSSKYHPVQACKECGNVRRVYCRDLCCACYLAARDAEEPGFLKARRKYMRQYMKDYKRECTYVEYISPMKAIRILVEAFEREGVSIDDVCSYIAMSRKLYCHDTTVPNKSTHRKWGSACRAS